MGVQKLSTEQINQQHNRNHIFKIYWTLGDNWGHFSLMKEYLPFLKLKKDRLLKIGTNNRFQMLQQVPIIGLVGNKPLHKLDSTSLDS